MWNLLVDGLAASGAIVIVVELVAYVVLVKFYPEEGIDGPIG
jgi:hypothetical protein